MKNLKETFKKLQADESLKGQIIANASEPNLTDTKTQKKLYKFNRHFGWQKIVASAMSFIMVFSLTLVLILQPWNNNGDGGNNGGETPGDGVVNGVLAPVESSRNDIIELIKSAGSNNDETAAGTDGKDDKVPETGEDHDIDYAATNIQQEGVDEGDIIKVDGSYIYTLSRLGLLIVNVVDEMRISYQESYENFYPDELYIWGNKLIVIGGEYSRFYYGYSSKDIGVEPIPWYGYRTNTKIIIYDLNDRVNVKISNEYSITGYFNTSRLIGNDLIVCINYDIIYQNEVSYFPKINNQAIDTKYIHLYKSGNYRSYLILASLNLDSNDLKFAAHLGLKSGWSVDYFSKNYLYSFVNIYEYYNYSWNTYAHIVKIDLNTLKHYSSQKIEGTVNNRYWADEYEDNLRVVSIVQKSNATRYTNVYVLNGKLDIIGTITNIAPGENIHAVRFNGNEGSIVTFLEIDPLFKLDLSNPQNPSISKGLKEEGVNDYLQYLSEDIILGLGRNTSTVNGWTEFKGMKIALYDNTGSDAINVNTINIGSGYVYSDALSNPKAILNDTAKNMFAFPVTMRGNEYRSLEGQGLMVFEYNLNAERNNDKLIYKGFLTNTEENVIYASWEDYYYDYFSYVKRGVRIGDKIYTISDRYIKSYDVNTLEFSEKLELTVDPCYFTHKWNNWTTTPATCTSDGEQVRYCQTCGLDQRYTLNALGHYWGNWEISAIPGSTGGGTETRYCHRCDEKETQHLVNHVGLNGLVLALKEEDNSYYVKTYKGSSTTIVIPAEHNGIPVNAIGDQAFLQSNIKSITIPNSVKNIGNEAFYDCVSLQSVIFETGSKLEVIGFYAFYSCTSLKTIIIPKGLTHLPYAMFFACYGLESVYFEENSQLLRIDSYAFGYCTKLKTVQLPQGVTSIEAVVFSGCESLENITIPSSVTSIGSSVFSWCTKLKSIHIPESLTSIAIGAFASNSSLESLTVASGNPIYKSDGNCIIEISTNTLIAGCSKSVIPEYVTSIGGNAFNGSGITSIVIPKNVEHIGYYSFANCSKLTSVVFEDGSLLKTIGQYAFSYSTNIASFNIVSNVTTVGYWVFNGWTNGQTINVYGAEDEYAGMVKLGANWKAGANAVINYFK